MERLRLMMDRIGAVGVALVLAAPAVGVGVAVGMGHDALAGLGVGFLVYVATLAGLMYVMLRGERLSRGQLRAIANSRGWEYTRRGAANPLPARGYPFSAVGDHRTGELVRGDQGGASFAILIHSVTERRRVAGLRRFYTIVAAHVPADLPVTTASPQRGWEAIEAAVGGQDMDVESAAFNDRWRVQGTDARGAHAILHPRALERLLRVDAGGCAITWDSNAVMQVTRGIKKSWDDLDGVLDLLADLASLVPDHLRRERPEVPFW